MFNYRGKSRISRNREMRENMSIILAAQKARAAASAAHKSVNSQPMTNNTVSQIFGFGPSPPSKKVTIADVPDLVTPAKCRASGVVQRIGLSNSISSRPVVRVPETPKQPFTIQNQVPPSPFLFKFVQPPPDTPQRAGAPNTALLLQSPWVQRGDAAAARARVTKQYSVKQLIDILCGDADENTMPQENSIWFSDIPPPKFDLPFQPMSPGTDPFFSDQNSIHPGSSDSDGFFSDPKSTVPPIGPSDCFFSEPPGSDSFFSDPKGTETFFSDSKGTETFFSDPTTILSSAGGPDSFFSDPMSILRPAPTTPTQAPGSPFKLSFGLTSIRDMYDSPSQQPLW